MALVVDHEVTVEAQQKGDQEAIGGTERGVVVESDTNDVEIKLCKVSHAESHTIALQSKAEPSRRQRLRRWTFCLRRNTLHSSRCSIRLKSVRSTGRSLPR
jgi:hypothetical protein